MKRTWIIINLVMAAIWAVRFHQVGEPWMLLVCVSFLFLAWIWAGRRA